MTEYVNRPLAHEITTSFSWILIDTPNLLNKTSQYGQSTSEGGNQSEVD
jgi:hypothetical protein